MALRKFIIERDIPAVGSLEREQLRGAAAKSNEVLAALGPDIQWQESYVAADKTFCVYLAKDEAIIHKHAEMSGFPATKITEIRKMIDPTTEHARRYPPLDLADGKFGRRTPLAGETDGSPLNLEKSATVQRARSEPAG